MRLVLVRALGRHVYLCVWRRGNVIVMAPERHSKFGCVGCDVVWQGVGLIILRYVFGYGEMSKVCRGPVG